LSNRPLRIAMVAACPYPVPQGSQVLIRDTARQLRDRGHDVHLFTYAHGIGECPAGLNVRRSATVRGAKRTKAGPSLHKPAQDFGLLRLLRRAVREESFDCVYAHNYEGLLIALLAGQRPIVYHAHNALTDELPHFFRAAAVARTFGRMLDRALPKRADAIIAPHARLADYLAECGCDQNRISVVPPAVERVESAAETLPAGLAPVLYTGNLDAYQNLGLLERAVTHARKSEPALEWIVATSEQTCRIRGATFVHTPDYDSVRAVLAKDAVIACPRVSWSGYPIKLLNALAAGRAVVACASAAYPIEDSVNGRAVTDGDAETFGDALVALARDAALRGALGDAGQETILREHAYDEVGALIECAVFDAVERAQSAPREATPHPNPLPEERGF
jgi:glycosyltransferase involved in cell wall biosynthesis